MNSKLIKGLTIIAAGGVTLKAIKAARYYKMQKELYEEVEEESEEEK